ncbi:MAG: CsgG/HfaB family protein [Candidatus Omnitrophica bacterium]|nr:CsgG/HfaB family protein [Candidatus Omnitrophota bacterium]
MKKAIFIIICGFWTVGLSGCSFMHHNGGSASRLASLPSYSGPKARVTVADFDVKATKATGEIGSDVRNMLVTALANSNRFAVVDYQKNQVALIQEQQLSVSAAPQAGDAPQPKLANKPADLIITASVTEFEPEMSGGRAGVGGGGGVGSGRWGGLLGSALSKSHMALDISIVDASTSKSLAVTRVQGQASDADGSNKNGFSGSGGLGAGLSAYANTPMEKAIRICIIEAVRYMSQAIPVDYYKYTDKG